MGMNKQTGNMYPFVTHTWNPIRGRCPHDCMYCYMKVYPLPELHFVKKELKTNLGSGNFIFVGSSTDMWAEGSDSMWISDVLSHCLRYPHNAYLLQTKNPRRYAGWKFPGDTILGVTIETNRSYIFGRAPIPHTRYKDFLKIEGRKMVSIEPIMQFDLVALVNWIRRIAPEFVSIGADSKGHSLPEPSATKVGALMEELSKFTEVKVKDNLKRLL